MFLSWRVTFQILGQSNKLNFVKAGTCFYILKLGFFENLKRVVFFYKYCIGKLRKLPEVSQTNLAFKFRAQPCMSCRENWQRELVIKYRFYFPEKQANFLTKTLQTGCYLPNFPKRSHTFDIFGLKNENVFIIVVEIKSN